MVSYHSIMLDTWIYTRNASKHKRNQILFTFRFYVYYVHAVGLMLVSFRVKGQLQLRPPIVRLRVLQWGLGRESN